MSCATPTHTNSNQLMKESIDGSVKLVNTPEGGFICIHTDKMKEKKQILLGDVYACFRNLEELKIEGCPRGQTRKWGCFQMCRDVCLISILFHSLLEHS